MWFEYCYFVCLFDQGQVNRDLLFFSIQNRLTIYDIKLNFCTTASSKKTNFATRMMVRAKSTELILWSEYLVHAGIRSRHNLYNKAWFNIRTSSAPPFCYALVKTIIIWGIKWHMSWKIMLISTVLKKLISIKLF